MNRKTFWQNAILLVMSFGIALLGGEYVVATFFPQNLGTWGMTRDGITSHVPNLSVHLNEFGQRITINSHGMRDREHSLAKPPGIFRILVLGDSFMEANQVALHESFPQLLEAGLGKQVEVINASVSGWGTDDEVTYLTRYGFQFEPDLILVAMTLHNDLQDNLEEEFHSFSDGQLREKPKQDISIGDFAVLQVKEFLASHSHLYQVLLHAKRFSWTQQAGDRLSSHVAALLMKESRPEVSQAWDMTKQLFRKMKVESERHGAKVIVFLIPLWVQVSDERLKAFLNEQHLSIEQIVLDQPQLHMKAIGQEVQTEIVDLLQEFQRVEKEHPRTLYLLNDGHWTAAGHRLAAGIVTERLTAFSISRSH